MKLHPCARGHQPCGGAHTAVTYRRERAEGSYIIAWRPTPVRVATSPAAALTRRSHTFSPHLGEVARAFLARVTELCGAAFWRKHRFYWRLHSGSGGAIAVGGERFVRGGGGRGGRGSMLWDGVQAVLGASCSATSGQPA